MPNHTRAVLRMIRIEETTSPSPFADMVDGLHDDTRIAAFDNDETMAIMTRGIHYLSQTVLPYDLIRRFSAIVRPSSSRMLFKL